MKKVLIIGAGTMGSGIAVVFAVNDYQVTLVDQTKEKAIASRKRSLDALMDLIEKRFLPAEWLKKTKENICYEGEEALEALVPAHSLIVESVFENAEVKRALYQKLDTLLSPTCIVCSNTSGLDVFKIAEISHPENFLITHWFNPPYIMELVEIVRGSQTSDETVASVKKLMIALGKNPTVINQYVPGFIANRLGAALMREAAYMVDHEWVTPEDIDAAITSTCGIRYAFEGPMALYDVVGWNIIQATAEEMYPTLCNDTTDGNSLARKLIEKGELGVMSKKGVFDYSMVLPQQYLADRAEKIMKLQRFVKEEILTEEEKQQ